MREPEQGKEAKDKPTHGRLSLSPRQDSRVPALHRSAPAPTIYLCYNRRREGGSCLPALKSMGGWLIRISFDQADFLGSALVVAFCKRSFRIRYFPKNRWVNVAMIVIPGIDPQEQAYTF